MYNYLSHWGYLRKIPRWSPPVIWLYSLCKDLRILGLAGTHAWYSPVSNEQWLLSRRVPPLKIVVTTISANLRWFVIIYSLLTTNHTIMFLSWCVTIINNILRKNLKLQFFQCQKEIWIVVKRFFSFNTRYTRRHWVSNWEWDFCRS